jgi:hypothetical protein
VLRGAPDVGRGLQRGARMKPASAAVSLALVLAAAPAHADDTVVAALESLTDPGSDAGSVISDAEAAAFAASVEVSYSGDEALLGAVIACRLRTEGAFADAAYTTVQRALRHRVDGLAVSLLQAPGLTFARASTEAPLSVAFDADGVAFTRVDVVYTWDDWFTTRATTLGAAGPDGVWRAELGVAPATGRLVYAVHVWGADGRDFWFNDGVENGVYGGQAFHDHSLRLEATNAVTSPTSSPVLAKLVRTFTHPDSPDGAAVGMDELSCLVEIVTWEGGPAIQDDDVLDPGIAQVDALVEAGVDFVVDHELVTGFLDRQRLRYGTYPAGAFTRAADGAVALELWDDVAAAEVFYTTDGWNLPHSERCARGAAGAMTCPIGYLPRGALLAYTIKLVDHDGGVRWQRVDRGLGAPSNFFHKVW